MSSYFKLRKNSIAIHEYIVALDRPFSCVLNITNLTASEYSSLCAALLKLHTSIIRVNTKLLTKVTSLRITGQCYILSSAHITDFPFLVVSLHAVLSDITAGLFLNFCYVSKQGLLGISFSELATIAVFNKLSVLHSVDTVRNELMIWLDTKELLQYTKDNANK